MSPRKKKPTLKIKSIEKMLEVSRDEYNNEHNRVTTLDTKMSIMLPLSSGYFLTLIPMCADYKNIFSTSISNFSDLILPTILTLSLTLSLLSAASAMLTMLYVVLPRKYKALNPAGFYKITNMTNEKVLYSALTVEYINITDHNRKQNEKRSKYYKLGCYFLALSIISLLIYTIIKDNLNLNN